MLRSIVFSIIVTTALLLASAVARQKTADETPQKPAATKTTDIKDKATEKSPDENSAATAKALSMDVFKNVLENRTVKFDADVVALFSKFIDKDEALAKKDEVKVIAKKLQESNVSLTFKEITLLITPDNGQSLCVKLVKHDDAVLRFLANVGLACSGDSVAAKRVHELIHDSSLSQVDKNLIRTWAGGVGIRVKEDSAEKILEHLTTVMGKTSKLKVGEAAPEFTVTTIADKKIASKELAGKIVVLHFWSTTCGPCIANMPMHIRQLEAYPKDKVVVIFVSIDDDDVKFKDISEKNKIPFHNVIEHDGWGGELARQFGVNKLPTDIVIDQESKIASFKIDDITDLLAK